jgi:hypothetical protein
MGSEWGESRPGSKVGPPSLPHPTLRLGREDTAGVGRFARARFHCGRLAATLQEGGAATGRGFGRGTEEGPTGRRRAEVRRRGRGWPWVQHAKARHANGARRTGVLFGMRQPLSLHTAIMARPLASV